VLLSFGKRSTRHTYLRKLVVAGVVLAWWDCAAVFVKGEGRPSCGLFKMDVIHDSSAHSRGLSSPALFQVKALHINNHDVLHAVIGRIINTEGVLVSATRQRWRPTDARPSSPCLFSIQSLLAYDLYRSYQCTKCPLSGPALERSAGGTLQAPLCPPPRLAPRRCKEHQGKYKGKPPPYPAPFHGHQEIGVGGKSGCSSPPVPSSSASALLSSFRSRGLSRILDI